jgi:hypothetical protein
LAKSPSCYSHTACSLLPALTPPRRFSLPPQNEPDLGGLGCINATTWLEHLTLRSQAVQNAYVHAAHGARCPAALLTRFALPRRRYEDFNGDVSAGRTPCPYNAPKLYILNQDASPCPIHPFVLASAFANGNMAGSADGVSGCVVGGRDGYTDCYTAEGQATVCSGVGSSYNCYFGSQSMARARGGRGKGACLPRA